MAFRKKDRVSIYSGRKNLVSEKVSYPSETPLSKDPMWLSPITCPLGFLLRTRRMSAGIGFQRTSWVFPVRLSGMSEFGTYWYCEPSWPLNAAGPVVFF